MIESLRASWQLLPVRLQRFGTFSAFYHDCGRVKVLSVLPTFDAVSPWTPQHSSRIILRCSQYSKTQGACFPVTFGKHIEDFQWYHHDSVMAQKGSKSITIKHILLLRCLKEQHAKDLTFLKTRQIYVHIHIYQFHNIVCQQNYVLKCHTAWHW